MNNIKEIFSSFEGETSEIIGEITLLVDEYFNSLYFGTDELSLSSFYIKVAEQYGSKDLVSITAPSKIIINPKNIITENKIYKIVYTCTNGQQYTQTYFYKNSSNEVSNLPFPYDIGDPRNYPKTFNLTLTGSFYKQHVLKIQVYEFLKEESKNIYYIFDLNSPNLNDNVFFNDLHLIYNKIFNFDDSILYIFESEEEKYILPIVAKWNYNNFYNKNLKITNINLKPYRISEPFETQSLNTHINSTDINFTTNYMIDTSYSFRNNIKLIGNKYYLTTYNENLIELGNFKPRT